MATDSTGIANLALTELGQDPIASIDDADQQAVLSKQFYNDARRQVLAEHTWNEATKRAVLTPPSGTTPPFGFDTAFDLPADFVRKVHVGDDRETEIFDYEIEGRQLLVRGVTDELKLVYIADDPPPASGLPVSDMGPLLQQAVALKLAEMLARPLNSSSAVREAVAQLYRDTLSEAMFMDSRDGSLEDLSAVAWLAGREKRTAEPFRRVGGFEQPL